MSLIRAAAYRYSGEQGILLRTLLGVITVIAVTSTVTACTGFLVIVLVVGMTYFSNRSHYQALVRSPQDLRHALQSLPREDDTLAGNLAEVFATHPRRLPRIQALREYAATPDYRRLQTKMDGSPI
jgi:hypothetical protein